MSEQDKLQARLVPARPAAEGDAAGFKQRLPWRWLAAGTLSLSLFAAFYVVREQRRVEALRSKILSVHDNVLAQPVQRYATTREMLEDLIEQAARQAPEPWADPRLRLNGLHAGKGLYLRIPAAQATSRANIARAAATAPADSIASCIGLAPASARDIWEKGEFLSTTWPDKVRKQDTVMKLRVTDEMLARQIEADLPRVVELLRSEWFLLILEQNQTGREGTVDAFLWDLRERRALLRARVVGEGTLLPARIRSKDAPVASHPPALPAGAKDVARDCSIAAQIRALADKPAQ